MKLVRESIEFHRGQDTKRALTLGKAKKEAEAKKIINDEYFLDDFIYEFDQNYNSAIELWMAHDKVKELIWEIIVNDKEVKVVDYENSEVAEELGLMDDEEWNAKTFEDHKIGPFLKEGWKIFDCESNFDTNEYILLR